MIQQLNKSIYGCRLLPILLLMSALILTGCAQLRPESSRSETEQQPPPQPYHPADFRDLLVPSELDWVRDRSMVVKTESFAGGILYFTGRVEVNSLGDFFITSMRNNGWKLIGSAKYKDVLMAFTKPNKTATIVISEAELGRRANVSIYITEEIVGGKREEAGPAARPTPFTF